MGTATRSFGSSSREGHDSSAFYLRKMNGNGLNIDESTEYNHSSHRNEIFCKSSENMSELPDNSVALMATSPPYNCGKEYEDDLTFDEFKELLRKVFRETYRVLEPGGRACINVAGMGRKPYKPLAYHIIELMQEFKYFHMRGEIIWQKADGANGSCAWGSFQSPKNPVLRDLHEHILIYCKGRFDRVRTGETTISKKDFMRDTLSVWKIPPASAKRVGHPAPFPIDIPARLIQLYTYKGDLVLDPFMGSGTTCIAAQEAGRDYIGYDVSKVYCKLAKSRLKH